MRPGRRWSGHPVSKVAETPAAPGALTPEHPGWYFAIRSSADAAASKNSIM
jgi:hypothetical protein